MRGGDFWSSLDFRVNEDIFHLCSPSLLDESLFLSPALGGSCSSSGLSSFVALGAGGASAKNTGDFGSAWWGAAGFPAGVAILSSVHREDAVAPKTPSWTRTPPADAISKTSTLSSIAGARDRPYGASPLSDTASVLTAAGSYRGPPRAGGCPPPTNGAPWHPPQPPATPGGLPPSSLARAGAIPVMVPAQSRAGSLV